MKQVTCVVLLLVSALAYSQTSQINRGSAYMTQQSYERALDEFIQAAALNPASTAAHVNRGIALLALGRAAEAQEALRQALQRNPDDARAHYNLGLIHRSEGNFEEALREFEIVRMLDPEDAFTSYFIASIHFQRRDYARALENYEKTIDLDPGFTSAYFGAGRSLVALQQTERAQVYLDRFRALTASSALNEAVGTQYGQQGPYSLVAEPEEALERPGSAIEVRFVDVSASAGLTGAGSSVCRIDYDRDGKPDLFVGTSLFRNESRGTIAFRNVTAAARIPRMDAVAGCAVGDYDNDDDPDIYLATAGAGVLLRNDRGVFTNAAANLDSAPVRASAAITFADLDHDGWLDLVLGQRAGAGVIVFRNRTDGTFQNVTAQSGIDVPGPVHSIIATDHDNDRDIDLLLTASASGPVVYSNNRDGSFSARSVTSGSTVAEYASVFDFDKDQRMDVVVTGGGPPVLLRNTATRDFSAVVLPAGMPGSLPGAAVLDFDNDGFLDFAFVARQDSGAAVRLLRNRGTEGFDDVSNRTRLSQATLRESERLMATDVDDDGDMDLIVTSRTRAPAVLRNDGGNRNGFLKLTLTGFRDNKMALGTKVELRGPGLRQKIEVHAAAHEIVFGTGSARADFVRMLWPTGVVQDEIPEGPRASYVELDRKGSSCPTLYSWDGARYRFITDIIGPGVIGEWVSPGVWNSPDPDEYVRLDGNDAAVVNGRYRFKVLSQMEEVTYLDAAKLLVVDTPPGVDVYPNDRYQPIQPYPEFKLWQAKDARPPASVFDATGRDLRREIAHRDGIFAPVPALRNYPGFAREHSITIDMGPAADAAARLIMHGYTAYFDSTSNYSAHHSGLLPIIPYLEVADGRGGWLLKNPSIGIPAGLPKTIVVDLEGLFASSDRRVRITTNMEIYWDQILVNTFRGNADMHVRSLQPVQAELSRGGYPLELRKKPEVYDYDRRSATDAFRIHGGTYTRLGGVTPLLQSADDMFVIMASGDEVTVEFDAASLPELPSEWKRTLLFFADGFEKPMETYTPSADSVEPLPFHAMSRYPYPAGEAYPKTFEHLRYRLEYNTRRLSARQPASAAYRRDISGMEQR